MNITVRRILTGCAAVLLLAGVVLAAQNIQGVLFPGDGTLRLPFNGGTGTQANFTSIYADATGVMKIKAHGGTAATVGDITAVVAGDGLTGGGTSDSVTVTLSTPVTVARGGTGQTTATAAFDALSPTTTQGDLIVRGASNNVRLPVGTVDLPLVSNGAGANPAYEVLALGGGGTGATDASGARTALGLAIGTDVQAFDVQLSSLAGLSYTGNSLKSIRVNAGETGFELAVAGGSDLATVLAGGRTTDGGAIIFQLDVDDTVSLEPEAVHSTYGTNQSALLLRGEDSEVIAFMDDPGDGFQYVILPYTSGLQWLVPGNNVGDDPTTNGGPGPYLYPDREEVGFSGDVVLASSYFRAAAYWGGAGNSNGVVFAHSGDSDTGLSFYANDMVNIVADHVEVARFTEGVADIGTAHFVAGTAVGTSTVGWVLDTGRWRASNASSGRVGVDVDHIKFQLDPDDQLMFDDFSPDAAWFLQDKGLAITDGTPEGTPIGFISDPTFAENGNTGIGYVVFRGGGGIQWNVGGGIDGVITDGDDPFLWPQTGADKDPRNLATGRLTVNTKLVLGTGLTADGAGTAANPILTSYEHYDTGIFWPTVNDTVSFTADGVETVRFSEGIADVGTGQFVGGTATGTNTAGWLATSTGWRPTNGTTGVGTTGYRFVYEDHTSDDTLTIEESGSYHTNYGAPALVTVTLPTVSVAGITYYFHTPEIGGQNMRIDPAPGTKIIWSVTLADGEYLEMAPESKLILVSRADGDWVELLDQGTITEQP